MKKKLFTKHDQYKLVKFTNRTKFKWEKHKVQKTKSKHKNENENEKKNNDKHLLDDIKLENITRVKATTEEKHTI